MNAFTSKALLKRLKSKKNVNGFTLIELMIVVAILGLLTSVGLPELQKALNRGKEAAAVSTLTNAAKECSLSLILNNDDSDYTAANFTAGTQSVGGSCAVADDGTGPTLTLTGEDGVDYEVEFNGTVPGVVGPAGA